MSELSGTHNTEWLDVIIDGRMVQINANGEIRCPHNPIETTGPIGMYHCPECGEMVIAGMSHPKYEEFYDKSKDQIGFRGSDNQARSPKNDVCAECRNKGTEEYCKSRKPNTFDCLEGD